MRPYLGGFWLAVFFLTFTGCVEGSADECGAEQESSCAPDSACAWTGDEQSACLRKCSGFEDCAEGEACVGRPLRIPSEGLGRDEVCISRDLIEFPEAPAEREAFQAECRARAPETCDRNPRCLREVAYRFDFELQCRALVSVGCFALGTSCTLSTFVAEDVAGDIFFFLAGCQNPDFTPVAFELDDPLFELLFEGENRADSWPLCG